MRKSRSYQIPGQIDLFTWLEDMRKCIPERIKYKFAPRLSWEHYGITKERHKELTLAIRSGKYTSLALSAAYAANENLAEYILLSATKNLSYEGLQTLWELREIERMPESRTNFYAWRRYFYHLFDLELRRIGK